MAAIRKMTTAQLKKEVNGYDKKELVSLVTDIYKNCQDAGHYLNIRLGDGTYEKALAAETREQVRAGFLQRAVGEN